MDALMCIDDLQCKKGLQLLAEPVGRETLIKRYGANAELIEKMGDLFGISGICHILGAIKTAKYYNFGKDDLIFTAATDSLDRYYSVIDEMAAQYGKLDEAAAVGRVEGVFHAAGTDWVLEGTKDVRERWHNLKYYTWVEQQGKSVQELDAQRDPQWWIGHQQRVQEIDKRLNALREAEAQKV
jgi:hypothetical protein